MPNTVDPDIKLLCQEQSVLILHGLHRPRLRINYGILHHEKNVCTAGSGISEPLSIKLHSVFCIQLFTCVVGGNKRMATEWR